VRALLGEGRDEQDANTAPLPHPPPA